MTPIKVGRAAQITPPLDIRDAALEEADCPEAEAGANPAEARQHRRRELGPEQEAEILGVVGQERRTFAAERRR